jgi:hypothetical protein
MKSDLKTILVAGSSGYTGAVLMRKFLEVGHKVKAPSSFIYRDDIFSAKDINTICNVNLISIEGDLHDPVEFGKIVSGCNVVVYFAQAPHEYNSKSDYDVFASLFNISKLADVERFVYVTDHPKDHTLFVEHLKNEDLSNISVIVVNVPESCETSLKQRVVVPLNIFIKRRISKHKVTLYGGKLMHETSIHELPDTWYVNYDSSDSVFYSNCIADLCLFISEQSLKKIQKKTWPYIITCKYFLNRFHIMRKIFQVLKPSYIPGRLKVLFMTIKRLFDVFLMMFFLHVWPEQVYRFSTRKCLAHKAVRFKKSSNPIIPFELIKERTSNIPKMKEINVVMRGTSFDIKRLDELDTPIFLVSFWEPVHTKKDVTYVMGRAQNALRLGKLGLDVINPEVSTIDSNGEISHLGIGKESSWLEQSIDEGIFNRIAILQKIWQPLKPSSPVWAPTGSALPAICALSYFAEKINIYGWDFYLESSPANMSYWQLYFNSYKVKIDRAIIGRTYLESAMINFYYGYHLSRFPNINIDGYLGQLDKHQKLIGKIERVLFND